jgi:hypothetical protein
MKAFGYKGEPETCRWCGKKLPKTKVTESVRVEYPSIIAGVEPGHGTEERPTGEVLVGYGNDHTFCSMRCGYQFGLVRALEKKR